MASRSVNNKITYIEENKKREIIQKITLIEDVNTLMTFNKGTTPILSVNKNEGKLSLEVAAGLLKDNTGNPMPEGFLDGFKFGEGSFDIKSKTNASIGQEVEITLKSATSSTPIKIVANATSITITKGDQTFSTGQTTLDMGIHSDAIEDWMGNYKREGSNASMFNQPEKLDSSFPLPLLGLYASQLKGTQKLSFGAFDIQTLDLNQGASHPYILFSDRNTTPSKKFIYANGSLTECKGFKLFYEPSNNDLKAVIVTGSDSAPKYYEFAITQEGDHENSFNPTAESQAALLALDDFFGGKGDLTNQNNSTNREVQLHVPGRNYAHNWKVERIDSRNNTSSSFKLRGGNFKVEGMEDDGPEINGPGNGLGGDGNGNGGNGKAPIITDPIGKDPIITDPIEGVGGTGKDPIIRDPIEGIGGKGRGVGGDGNGLGGDGNGNGLGGDGNDPTKKGPIINDPIENDPIVNDPIINDPIENGPINGGNGNGGNTNGGNTTINVGGNTTINVEGPTININGIIAPDPALDAERKAVAAAQLTRQHADKVIEGHNKLIINDTTSDILDLYSKLHVDYQEVQSLYKETSEYASQANTPGSLFAFNTAKTALQEAQDSHEKAKEFARKFFKEHREEFAKLVQDVMNKEQEIMDAYDATVAADVGAKAARESAQKAAEVAAALEIAAETVEQLADELLDVTQVGVFTKKNDQITHVRQSVLIARSFSAKTKEIADQKTAEEEAAAIAEKNIVIAAQGAVNGAILVLKTTRIEANKENAHVNAIASIKEARTHAAEARKHANEAETPAALAAAQEAEEAAQKAYNDYFAQLKADAEKAAAKAARLLKHAEEEKDPVRARMFARQAEEAHQETIHATNRANAAMEALKTPEEEKKARQEDLDKIVAGAKTSSTNADANAKTKEEEDAKRRAPVKTKRSYTKEMVEGTSMALGTGIAALLIVGALLTGVGALAFAGLAAFGIGTLGVQFAGKLNYEYYKKAHIAVDQQELEEREDAEEAENFLAAEADLDIEEERIQEISAVLGENLNNENIRTLTNAYNAYGVGFNALPDAQTRSERLLSLNGHNIRTSMVDGFNAIESAADDTAKGIAADRFIRTHFNIDNMPPAERNELRTLLISGDPELREVFTSMNTLNTAENSFNEKYTTQRQTLGTARDAVIARIIQSDSLDEAARTRLLQRHGSVIYRHFALDPNMSQAKLEKLFEKLPEDERAACLAQMHGIGARMEAEIEGLEAIAMEDRTLADEYNNTRNDARSYVRTMTQISNAGEIANYSSIYDSTDNYLKLQTVRTNNTITLQNFDFQPNSIELKFVSAAQNPIAGHRGIDKPNSPNNQMKNLYAEIYQEAKGAGILSEITRLYVDGGATSALPQITTDTLEKSDTLFELIRRMAATNPSIMQKFARLEELKVEIHMHSLKQVIKTAKANAGTLFGRISRAAFERELNTETPSIRAMMDHHLHDPNSTLKPLLESTNEETRNVAMQILILQVKIINQIGTLNASIEELSKNKKENADEIAKAIRKRDSLNNTLRAIRYAIGNDVITHFDSQMQNNSLEVNHETLEADATTVSINLSRDINAFQGKNMMLSTLPVNERNRVAEEIDRRIAENPSTNIKQTMIDVIREFYGNNEIKIDGRIYTFNEILENNKVDGHYDSIGATNFINQGMFTNQRGAHSNLEISCVKNDLGNTFADQTYGSVYISGESYHEDSRVGLTDEELEDERMLGEDIEHLTNINTRFVSAWEKALNGDFAELTALLQDNNTVQILDGGLTRGSTFGTNGTHRVQGFRIDVAHIRNILNRVAGVPDAERAEAIRRAVIALKLEESTYGYSRAGFEVIHESRKRLERFRQYRTGMNVDITITPDIIAAEEMVEDCDNFTKKYTAIRNLKLPAGEIRRLLTLFANGHIRELNETIKGIHFSRRDVEMFGRLHLTPDQIIESAPETISKHIEDLLNDAQERVEQHIRRASDPHNAERDYQLNPEAPNGRQLRHRLRVVGYACENAQNKIEYEKARRAREAELLGELEAEAEETNEAENEHENVDESAAS